MKKMAKWRGKESKIRQSQVLRLLKNQATYNGKKRKNRILLFFFTLDVQVAKFFLIIVKCYNFQKSGISFLSRSSSMGVRHGWCEHHISETMERKDYSLVLSGEKKKHFEKLLIVTLIFQSEAISQFNFFLLEIKLL